MGDSESMLDRLKHLRAQRAELTGQRWSVGNMNVRCFSGTAPHDREQTADTDLIAKSLRYCERSGPNISYSGSMAVGDAARKAVLYFLDKEIERTAHMARSEAEEVMRLTNGEAEPEQAAERTVNDG